MALSNLFSTKFEKCSKCEPLAILRQWKIPADHYAVMQLLLGYSKEGDKHPAPKPRKEGRIIRIGGGEA